MSRDPAPCAAPLAQPLGDGRHRLRGNGEVVDPVLPRAVLLVDLVQERDELVGLGLVGEVHREVLRRRGEPVPDLLLEVVAPELADRVLHPVAELVVRPLGACGSDDREALGQEAAVGERVERREDLAPGEVARGAEDDEDARLRSPARPKPFEERVLLRLGLSLGHLNCPASDTRRVSNRRGVRLPARAVEPIDGWRHVRAAHVWRLTPDMALLIASSSRGGRRTGLGGRR